MRFRTMWIPCCSNRYNFGLKLVFRYRQTVFQQGFDIKINGFSYVFQCFLFRLALRDAARQTRTFHHPETILAGIDQNLTLLVHSFSVSGLGTRLPFC